MASILPFGYRHSVPLNAMTTTGEPIELKDDYGNLILIAASQKLSPDGIGLFVVTPSFFFSSRSVFHQFRTLGIGLEAALALPSGAFAPYTNIQSYLVIVRKYPISKMFVAQLSNDAKANLQIIDNLTNGKEGCSLELGRFVDPLSFRGLDAIRGQERFEQFKQKFGVPAVCIEEIATKICLGRTGDDFEFQPLSNAVYIPLIGISNVVDSLEELTLKNQNYAQVAIDPSRSNAMFVARFLNSEFGKELRELSKSGVTIPKLNTQSLKDLRVFVPDLQAQISMMEVEMRVIAEQNTLLGLQNELADLRRVLWSDPRSTENIGERIKGFSSRLSGGLKQHTDERLDQWFETLPFPLASILRAWQAAPSQDFKTKHEHLLHFFEATAEFISVILLSAFSSNESFFVPHNLKLKESLQKQKQSLERATFGTWRVVLEYLGKQTRQLLQDDRSLCVALFEDTSCNLPEALSRKEIASILATTNKMRNDWSHGGVVGQEEARLRNEQLIGELQKLRGVLADTWAEAQLLHALHCRPRRGIFENEIAILMGSNSEFLKETRTMAAWLDVESLYLSRKDSDRALKLIPMIQVGHSPQSAKNACYFYSRIERDGIRFVSYHFVDQPEHMVSKEDDMSISLGFLFQN